jgi:ketosteroid isomerase-like protein
VSASSRLGERVLEYFRLVDAGRIAEMYELFTDDIVYRRAGLEPIVGKAALVAFYEGPRGIERIRHDIEIVAVEGNSVALEGRARATLTNGGSFDRRIAEFFWFEGDLIARRHGYMDIAP